MTFIILLIVVICGLQIINSRGQKRYEWFICSVLLLSSSIVVTTKPHLGSHRFFILAYWASVFYHNEYKKTYSFPLKAILVVYFICLVISCLNAPQIPLFYKIYKPFILMVATFLLLMMGYATGNRLQLVSKPIVITLYIVTIYGLFTFFSHTDPIRSIIKPDFSITYFWGERLRTASTWSHPISYGFICSIFFWLVFKEYKKNDKYILLFLLAVNVFICGSRTAIVCFVSMMCLFWLFAYNLKKKAKYGIAALLSTFLFVSFPYISEKTSETYDSAMGQSDVGGSSINMRLRQLDAVLYESRNFRLTGGGLDYSKEVLGLGKEDWSQVKGDLFGMESYLFNILMERGIIGLCVEILLISVLM